VRELVLVLANGEDSTRIKASKVSVLLLMGLLMNLVAGLRQYPSTAIPKEVVSSRRLVGTLPREKRSIQKHFPTLLAELAWAVDGLLDVVCPGLAESELYPMPRTA
jgi:hypothetical protein